MGEWRWRKGLVGVVALLAFFAVATTAQAASFTVNTTVDGTQFNPGVDLNCETALGNHQCTLRAAVMETNAIGGTNTITLHSNPSAYKLTITSGTEETAQGGDLDVINDQSLTITGDGASSTVIDGNHIDRVFDVASGSTLNMSGVTIENGVAPAPNGTAGFGDGGGIRSRGTLNLSNSIVLNNATSKAGGGNAGVGGGVSTDGTSPTTLTNVDFNGNSATDGGSCGAVNESGGSQVTVTGGSMEHNTANFAGGICENSLGSPSHEVDITGTNIHDNSVFLTKGINEGGGVVQEGSEPVTLTNVTVTGNTAEFGAGVVQDGGQNVNIINSTISGNHAIHNSASAQVTTENGSGGGIGEDGGFAVNITRSTISGNTAVLHGGGLMANGGAGFPGGSGFPFLIVDSTITGNTASGGGGGGLRIDGDDRIQLVNDTVSGNSSQGGGNLGICDVSHTGDNVCDGHFSVQNTIVSGGSPSNCSASGKDISIDSQGHNIDSGTSCGFAQTGDLNNTNPQLGPLQPNGGPTQTEALATGSPAINAGDNTACGTGSGMSGPGDQRGLPRISGPACDIGAFELQPGEVTSPPVVTSIGPPLSVIAKPRIRVSGLPRACVRGTFHLTVTITSAVPLSKVHIARDGHAVHSKKKKRQRITVNAGALGQGRHHIKISARNSAGTTNKTVSFRRCAPPRVLPRFTG